MRAPTTAEMEFLIGRLNWNGHVELPDNDVKWLAEEIARKLAGKGNTCEGCGQDRVTRATKMGALCHPCASEIMKEFT